MKRILLAAFVFCAIAVSAQTQLNAVQFHVTKLVCGQTIASGPYQADAHLDNIITVDTNGRYLETTGANGTTGSDSTYILLPDLMPSAPYFSPPTYGQTYLIEFQSPVDSSTRAIINGFTNATTGYELINGASTPYYLTISTTSVKLTWLGGSVGWRVN